MSVPRILVAGIGNIFLGDDAFGVEVAQRLMRQPPSPDVRVIDFGIRGIDLMYALLAGYEAVILVDAVQRGKPPGTLFLIEPSQADVADESAANPLLNLHVFDPAKVLAAARSMGGPLQHVLLIGCEPLLTHDDDPPRGLSGPVAAAVDEAVRMVESVLAELRNRMPDPKSANRVPTENSRSFSLLTKEV